MLDDLGTLKPECLIHMNIHKWTEILYTYSPGQNLKTGGKNDKHLHFMLVVHDQVVGREI